MSKSKAAEIIVLSDCAFSFRHLLGVQIKHKSYIDEETKKYSYKEDGTYIILWDPGSNHGKTTSISSSEKIEVVLDKIREAAKAYNRRISQGNTYY